MLVRTHTARILIHWFRYQYAHDPVPYCLGAEVMRLAPVDRDSLETKGHNHRLMLEGINSIFTWNLGPAHMALQHMTRVEVGGGRGPTHYRLDTWSAP
jgi:hypothetical protein